MKKFTSYAVSAFLLFQMLTALSASAQWTLVENFNSLTDGALNGQSSWTASGAGADVAADPANASNKVLRISTTNTQAYKSMFTPTSSSVYTVFYRIRIDNIDNSTVASGESAGFGGVSDAATPTAFTNYRVQNGVNPTFGTPACVNGNTQATSYFHCTTTGTISNKFLTTNHPVSDTWYNLWFVIDNDGFSNGGSAQYRVYIQGGVYTTPTLLQWNDVDITNHCENLITENVLRGGGSLSTSVVSKIFFRTGALHASPLYFDDIYYCQGENTNHPMWTLVENFNSLTNGALHSQNSWTTGFGTSASNFSSETTSDVAVAADPANASNKVLSISGTHRGAYKSMFTPAAGSVYTVFYRIRIDNIDNLNVASGESAGFGGVTDVSSPGFFSHYKVQNGVNPTFGTPACDPNVTQATSYFHSVSGTTQPNKFLTSNHPVSDTWYNLWFVIDNNGFSDGGAAQYRVYIQGGAYTTTTLLQWSDENLSTSKCSTLVTDLPLRGTAGSSLSTSEISKIFFRTGADHASPLYFDDIYYSPETNLSRPDPTYPDYRSAGNVNFTSATNWQFDAGNSVWTTALQAPTNLNNILIRNTDVATLNTNFSILEDKNFTLTGGSLVIDPGFVLDVANRGTANFGARSVTLKSDASGTAIIGQISGTGAITNATNVTVERYIPAKRAWRLLSAPLKGTSANSIFDNWQNTGTGTGINIFAPGGSGSGGNGITQGGVASSILSYNTSSDTWQNVENTKTSYVFNGSSNGSNNSYAVFVTGPYSSSNIGGSAQATTLRPTGTLQTGGVTFGSLTQNQFHLIGNPYASPVNLNLVDKTNISAIYVWDAQASGLGTYRTWSGGSWVLPPTGSNYSNNPIVQSGQAFFVRATGGTGSLTFAEDDKVTNTNHTATFRTSSTDQVLRAEISQMVNNVADLRDVAVIRFDAGYRKAVDDLDIVKLPNFAENIAARRNGTNLIIERYPLITENDTLYLRTWNLANADYALSFNAENFSLPSGITAFVQDLVSGSEYTLNIGQANAIRFTVNSSNSGVNDRFRIVFRSNAVTPVVDLNGAKGFGIYPNPIAKGTDLQLEFRNRPAGKYTVTIYSIAGVRMQQQVLRHNGGTAVQTLNLNNQLSTGNYLVELMNEKGEKEQVKISIQ